ncbi:MAG: hypothetical protein QGH40_06000 [bacterium]|jgi:hypothetical protein|nr:hypothetical protein [bacterium]
MGKGKANSKASVIKSILIVLAIAALAVGGRALLNKALTPGIDEQIASHAREANVDLPIMVNSDTRLDKIMTGESKSFSYRYTLVNAIAPLLQNSGYLQPTTPLPGVESTLPQHTPKFVLPAHVTQPLRSLEKSLIEEAMFFERFTAVVNASGFLYREIDLQRFHLSIKCGDITILGGDSGIGKTSLPLLYARALAGGEAGREGMDCLMVSVNPSWMDVRDILGHMNTLDGYFYPAESGLFQYLICAQEDFRSHHERSPIYIVCLDEMNLSQVEHYFSDFIQILERPLEGRTLRCFTKEVAGALCPFRAYSSLNLPASLRFVGTVNFDETTRQLSNRLLDRSNMIIIQAGNLPSVSLEHQGQAIATVPGPQVELQDLLQWRTEKPLSPDLAEILDQLRPHLKKVGCPLSPRVYRAICTFAARSALRNIGPYMRSPIDVVDYGQYRFRHIVTEAVHWANRSCDRFESWCAFT